MRTRTVARGTTLVELMVTLALLGILSAVGTMQLRSLPAPSTEDPASVLRAVRRTALATGRVVTGRVVVRDSSFEFAAYPDGSVVSDSASGIQRLTGVLRRAR